MKRTAVNKDTPFVYFYFWNSPCLSYLNLCDTIKGK